jgi:pyruvate dehydrogenase E2 component (dihydrolipoamide acetyltransferase)
MALVEVQVPDIGDLDEVAVIELMVKVGDTVKAEQSLITVESDKASMEIPSSTAGVVKEMRVALGDKVKQGSVVLVLEAQSVVGLASSVERVQPAAMPQAPAPAPTVAPTPNAQPSTPNPASSTFEVHVPNIGDFKDVAVIEVMVKPGDSIKAEQSLITVESDKASMEIPSSHAGVLKELKVKVGDTVNIGDLLAVLTVQGSALSVERGAMPAAIPAASVPASTSTPASAAQAISALNTERPTLNAPGGLPHASPSVRKFARELGVPLAEVKGSGLKGRITEADVQAFTQAVMSGAAQTKAQAAKTPATSGGGGSELGLIPWPKVDFAKFGPIERKEMGRIKKISGANLLRNAIMIPAVTNHERANSAPQK